MAVYFLFNLGRIRLPFAFEHFDLLEDVYFRNFIKVKCNNLAIQSWPTKTTENSLSKIDAWYKSELKMERYFTLLKPNKRNIFARFRYALSWLQPVQDRFNDTSDHLCKLYKTSCIPDEFHFSFRCPRFDVFRNRKLGSLGPSPNMHTLHTLMNVINIIKLIKLTNFCEHIGSSMINEVGTDCALNLNFC